MKLPPKTPSCTGTESPIVPPTVAMPNVSNIFSGAKRDVIAKKMTAYCTSSSPRLTPNASSGSRSRCRRALLRTASSASRALGQKRPSSRPSQLVRDTPRTTMAPIPTTTSCAPNAPASGSDTPRAPPAHRTDQRPSATSDAVSIVVAAAAVSERRVRSRSIPALTPSPVPRPPGASSATA